MPSGTATVTAKTGPAVQATALSITNVTDMNYDIAGQTLTFFKTDSTYKEFDMSGVTTFTVTISGGNATITIS